MMGFVVAALVLDGALVVDQVLLYLLPMMVKGVSLPDLHRIWPDY